MQTVCGLLRLLFMLTLILQFFVLVTTTKILLIEHICTIVQLPIHSTLALSLCVGSNIL